MTTVERVYQPSWKCGACGNYVVELYVTWGGTQEDDNPPLPKVVLKLCMSCATHITTDLALATGLVTLSR